MSLEKQLQGDEFESHGSQQVRPMSGRERAHRRLQEALSKRATLKIPDNNYAEEKEEEKDHIFEIQSTYLRGNENNQSNGLAYSNKRQIGPRSLPESPFSSKNNLRLSFKNFGKAIEYGDDVNAQGEDSVDLPAYNHEFMKSTIYSPNRKSPRKKASIPLIRPILETRENAIQKMIEEAEPNTLIHLPDLNIKLPYLHLTKPVTIKGVPGSEIKLTQGPILIDIKGDKTKSTGNKVIFCECTIHAEYSKQRLLDSINTKSDSRRGATTQKESEDSFKLMGRKVLSSTKSDFNTVRPKLHDSSLILFQVNSGSVLEVRDCQIKSMIREGVLTSEETKHMNDIQDTAFWLHNEDDSLENPALIMSSTTISGFHTFINSENLCSSVISKSFMSNCRGHACNFENPKLVKLSENIFEKSTKSAINIKFSKETIDDKTHSITIKNNEINHSSSYGISIFGEHLKPLNVSILIDYNKISHSKKDSLGIKFLNIAELKISHNDIEYSKGNGISLQNVFDTMNSTQIYLRKNKIQFSEANGVIFKDCPVLMEYNDINQNNKNGLFIVLEDYDKEGKDQSQSHSNNLYKKIDFRIILNNCNILLNKESGINLAGSLKGPMLMNSCRMAENLYGIYITEKESGESALKVTNTSLSNKLTLNGVNSPHKAGKEKKKMIKGSTKKPVIRSHCHFSIEKCEITRNNIAGIYLKKLLSEMYFSETYVNINKEQALFMEDFNDKEQIRLKEQEKTRISEYFHGYVGGYWGELYEERPTSCKNNCTIF